MSTPQAGSGGSGRGAFGAFAVAGAAMGAVGAIGLGAYCYLQRYLARNYSHIDPQLRLSGFIMDRFLGAPTEGAIRRFAALTKVYRPPLPARPDLHTEEFSIPSRSGGPDIPVVMMRPLHGTPDATGLLWLHGGGIAAGNPHIEARFLHLFPRVTNTVLIAPDYRLSVDAPYPAAINDCYDTLAWMWDHAEELGINPRQLAIAGGSAGGGLTAATTLRARDRGEIPIAFHFPLYPMIDDRMQSASMRGNKEFVWNEARNRIAWRLYLGALYESAAIPTDAAPARENDLQGMPPAYTYVGDCDPFRDDTIAWIQGLQDAGVEATYDIYPGAFHAFDVLNADVSHQALERLLERYQYAVENWFSPGRSAD
ncbi:MAG: alpha/beta hydrolase [Actinomycetaceae bacterium]|nr:alpha/beta hydrolase [Actinomycetaceae bacterium]